MDILSRWYTAWFFGFSLLAPVTPGAAARDPDCDTIWRVVAQSHVIVTGTLQVPVESVRKSISSKKYEYVQINVICDQVLKAKARKTISVRWYTEPNEYSPSAERVMALDGKKVILFLVEADDEAAKGFYFVSGTFCALSEANTGLVERIRSEVKMQRDLSEGLAKVFPPKDEPLYAKVKGLIEATTHKDTQMAAFRDLEALGPKGVPAIILLMDDRRRLGEGAISLRNAPSHWEGIRHYRPETVTDAMAAILNQITGDSFGCIYNGGSERERREAVNGWRIYLYHRKSAELSRNETPTR